MTAPDTPPRPRLYREARDLAGATLACLILALAWRVLSWVAPWTLWWPVLATLTLALGLAASTPPGSTTVRHALACAVTHPGATLLVAAVICLPWLGGWTATLITTGAREAVTAALDVVPHPSLPQVPDLFGLLRSHLGGVR